MRGSYRGHRRDQVKPKRANPKFREKKEKELKKSILFRYFQFRRKLNNKYLELQDQYNELMNKYSNSEKNKLRLQAQVDNLITELDSVNTKFTYDKPETDNINIVLKNIHIPTF